MACKNVTSKAEEKSVETEKLTQALILQQPFDFDVEDKGKITGAYVAKTKIEIPANLATQNRWIMFEGPILENDAMAYRFYADTRHRSDIYAKSTGNLVMDTVGWNYHEIQNWGSDVLHVGNSLGIGSPAIFYQDSLYAFSNHGEKTIEVIENGDQKSTIRFTFKDLKIRDFTIDVTHDWSTYAGDASTMNRLKITKGKLAEGAVFATGIVKHLESLTTGESEGKFYAYTWGIQSFHKENLGMAIFASDEYEPTHISNSESHVFTFNNASDEVAYGFLAGWTRGTKAVNSDSEFMAEVVESCSKNFD